MNDDREKTNEFLRSVISLCNEAVSTDDEDARFDAIEDAITDLQKAFSNLEFESEEDE